MDEQPVQGFPSWDIDQLIFLFMLKIHCEIPVQEHSPSTAVCCLTTCIVSLKSLLSLQKMEELRKGSCSETLQCHFSVSLPQGENSSGWNMTFCLLLVLPLSPSPLSLPSLPFLITNPYYASHINWGSDTRLAGTQSNRKGERGDWRRIL